MNECRFMTKSLRVDLYYVQDQLTWGRFSLGSGLEMNKLRFRTKSPGVVLY